MAENRLFSDLEENMVSMRLWRKYKEGGYRSYDILRFAVSFYQAEIVVFWETALLYLKAKVLGVDIGKRIKCWGKIDILPCPGSTIKIGDKVSIISSSKRCTAGPIYAPTKFRTFTKQAAIVIGNGVGLNGTSITCRSKEIRIGSGTMIAPNVIIFDSDFHALWPPENRIENPAFENDAGVNIGKNVWIGSSVIIKKGVSIGDNSVIAAGSIVSKDIPENVLAAGVPAKVVRQFI